MSFDTGIPNIRVVIREATDENLTIDIPNIAVKLEQGSQYNVNLIPNTVTTLRTGSFNTYADVAGLAYTASIANLATSSSYALTASYAVNAGAGAGFPFSGSAVITGSLFVSGGNAIISGSLNVLSGITGSLLGTASVSSTVLGGTENYIPLWATDTTLSSSRIFQTQSSILIGATTQHTPEAPDILGIFAETGSTSYNLISGHGNVDSYLQLNIKNFNGGATASSDIVATADTGDEVSGFVNMGINSSGYTNAGGGIGNALDAYLFVQEAGNLLIGNKSIDKSVVIFTGEGDAIQNARILVDPSGSVGINSSQFNVTNPEALLVQAINDQSYNLIRGTAGVDNYIQFNIQNISTGFTASSDIVATADNGNETTNYVDLGINNSQYAGTLGGPNDAYLYSAGNHLHIGTINPNQDVMIFVGSDEVDAATKLTLRDNNIHSLTGSLEVTNGGVTSSLYGTASWAEYAITASYAVNSEAGFPFSGSAVITGSLLVSSSGITVIGNGVTASLFGTSSWATNAITASAANSITFTSFSNASYYFPQNIRVDGTLTAQVLQTEFVTASVIYESGSTKFGDSADDTHQFTGSLSVLGTISGSLVLPSGIVSSSRQVNTGSFSGSFIGSLTGTSSVAVSSSFSSLALTSSYANYAVTASYISGGLSIPNGLAISGSLVVTGSAIITGSLNVTQGITGSVLGTASWANNAVSASFSTTASAATSITFIPASSSFATTASAATSITFIPNTASFAVTASYAINAGAGAGFPFSGSAVITGSLLVSGSGVTITGSLGVLHGITGSLFGTASHAVSASWAPLVITGIGTVILSETFEADGVTSNYTLTNAYDISSVFVSVGGLSYTYATDYTLFGTTLSFVEAPPSQSNILIRSILNATTSASGTFTGSFLGTSSYAYTASYVDYTNVGNKPTLVSSSIQINTGSFTGSFVGSLLGTSSWASNAITSSFATTASAADSITFIPSSASFATTSSYSVTASYALNGGGSGESFHPFLFI